MDKRLSLPGSRDRDAGFSLVELIVAMMVIAVALMVLIAVQIRAAVTVTEARKIQQATAFANEAVEQLHSIPWSILSKGMYADFVSASGGDPYVQGTNLKVDNLTVPLIIAAPGSDGSGGSQDLSSAALPLFDTSGKNVQVRDDPSLVGIDFTIRAYVTDSSGGSADGIVGLAVVVSWPEANGQTRHTTIWSEAYRGSAGACGDPDTQPFLAACQSFLQASSSSGNITVGISALNVDADPANIYPQSLMYPESGTEYTATVRTADAAATVRSQQVTYVDSLVEYGGNTWDDNDPATDEHNFGYNVHELYATDDLLNQGGWLASPLPVTTTQNGSEESQTTISHSSSPVELWLRSDYGRIGTLTPSTTNSCLTGIPAGQACAKSTLSNNSSDWNTGSGYLIVDVDGQAIRASRRLSNESGSSGNTDLAWVGRFASAPGTSAVGCTSLSGAGCVSAGATRTNAVLDIGTIVGGSWDGDAPDGMVVIQGDSGCSYYEDSVLVQRGANQTTTAPTVSRCGSVKYWNGTGYSTLSLSASTDAVVDSAPVTWTKDIYTVTGTTQVQVLPAVIDNPAPADAACKTAACTVTAQSGAISIVSTYHLAWGSHEHVLIVTTTITAPSASATYKAAGSGA